MLTKRGWWAHLQKAIGLTLKYESKPLKSMYFMSDAYTCKILKISNSFAIRSSSQRKNEKNEYIKQLNYKITY